jgi:hypothetical protein
MCYRARGHPAREARVAGQAQGIPVRRGIHVLAALALLFPQHGPGRKHERPIHLEPWQGAIVVRYPHLFVRGLIHSDGCRIVANDRGRLTARYHFSNLSDDIKTLYCLALGQLGVRWTRPCDKQIAVYRKASVAVLDRFIGPKC